MTKLFRKAISKFEANYGKEYELREMFVEEWRDGIDGEFRIEAVSKVDGKYYTLYISVEA